MVQERFLFWYRGNDCFLLDGTVGDGCALDLFFYSRGGRKFEL